MPEINTYINPETQQIYFELENFSYDSSFWDQHWYLERNKNWNQLYRSSFVSRITLNHLDLGSKVLDAGCGDGRHIYALMNSGFDSFGLDYAYESVMYIKSTNPDIKVDLGDVRKMPYSEGSIDGIWSIGVIEHFFDGYSEILAEASRCLRVGGYLFLTFPTMNPFRYLQIRFRHYFSLEVKPIDRKRFYQYLLNPSEVERNACRFNFIKRKISYRSGLKGLKDAFKDTSLGALLNIAINKSTRGDVFLRIFLKSCDIVLSPFMGHSCLIILQKI